MQHEFVSETEKNIPSIVIVVQFPFSWLASDNTHNYVFYWKDKFLKKYFEPVVVIEYISPYEAYWIEGEDITTSMNSQNPKIIVYKQLIRHSING